MTRLIDVAAEWLSEGAVSTGHRPFTTREAASLSKETPISYRGGARKNCRTPVPREATRKYQSSSSRRWASAVVEERRARYGTSSFTPLLTLKEGSTVARKEITTYEIIDSLTQKPLKEEEAQQVVLTLDGQVYELDLAQASHEKLLKALEPFTANETPQRATAYYGGRATGTGRTRNTTPAPRLTAEERAAITTWAAGKKNPVTVAPKGRVAAGLVDEWTAEGRPGV